jgi:hypothetical protein
MTRCRRQAKVERRCGLLEEEGGLGLRSPKCVVARAAEYRWDGLPRCAMVTRHASIAALRAWCGMMCGSGAVAGVSADGTRVRGQGLQNLGMHPELVLQSVEALLQFAAVARTQAWFLSFPVLADGAIAAAPPARRLSSITFDLVWSAECREEVDGYGVELEQRRTGTYFPLFAQLASGRRQHPTARTGRAIRLPPRPVTRLLTTRRWGACVCRDELHRAGRHHCRGRLRCSGHRRCRRGRVANAGSVEGEGEGEGEDANAGLSRSATTGCPGRGRGHCTEHLAAASW